VASVVDVDLAFQPAPVRQAAHVLFGEQLSLAERYAGLLVTHGVVRGLIGPREAPRIWERHLLNCTAVAELVPKGATLTDVGSGAGLPGLALAVARPDLAVTLLDPALRRTTFLTEAVDALDLATRVRVVRGRAEEVVGRIPEAGVVTARALAPLDRLAAWCLPLVMPGGRVLALKGSSAAEEVATHAATISTLGGGEPTIHHCRAGVVEPPTVVVQIIRERVVVRRGARRR
jgi:16S rRNA (guanine527-N7)-methyltransferase